MNDNRIHWLDTAKWIAIVVVIIGHMSRRTDAVTWISCPDWVRSWLYLWHMPVFSYITGVVTTRQTRWSSLVTLGVTAVMIAAIQKISFIGSFNPSDINHTGFENGGIVWYLYAIIIWRAGAWGWWRLTDRSPWLRDRADKIHPRALWMASVILAITFVKFEWMKESSWGVWRTAMHTPFFFAGLLWPRAFDQPAKNPTKIAALCALALVAYASYWAERAGMRWIIGIDCRGDYGHGIVSYALATSLSASICVLVPKQSIKLFGWNLTAAGRLTMYTFLIDPVARRVLVLFASTALFKQADMAVMSLVGRGSVGFGLTDLITSVSPMWCPLVVLVLYAITLAIITTRPAVVRRLQWLYPLNGRPHWWLFKTPPK